MPRGHRPPSDPCQTGWTLLGPVPKLGPGWVSSHTCMRMVTCSHTRAYGHLLTRACAWPQILYKKPRPKPSHHVDSLFIAPDGERFKSFSSSQRYALQTDGQTTCSACGSGEYELNNDIMLCDGKGCGQAFHQHCLVEPLFAVPVGEWYCPDCERGEPGGHLRHLPAVAPTQHRPTVAATERVWYQLDHASLRPGCIALGCAGVARHVPDPNGPSSTPGSTASSSTSSSTAPSTTFECELCGTQLQSQWWCASPAPASPVRARDLSRPHHRIPVRTCTPGRTLAARSARDRSVAAHVTAHGPG